MMMCLTVYHHVYPLKITEKLSIEPVGGKKRHKSKFCVPSEMLIMRIAKFSGGGSGDE
jgi:hypothetical protein